MNPAEYDNLEAKEREHWYYAGKREVVRRWLQRTAAGGPNQTLLDCGAGTGFFAQEMAAQYRVLVLDDHEEALTRLRRKFPPEQVLRVSADGIPLPTASVDAVTALDVFEHIADDAGAAREFARVVRPGGVAVITVPASMALWSDWDAGLHHFRRYDRDELQALFPSTDWELVYLNYTNVLVYPAVWLVRRWRSRMAARKPLGGTRSEDRIPPRWLNGLLRSVFVGMSQSRISFPFGVSLLLVARRRN